MRIAIPSDNERFIAAHTGRCRGFVIVEVENGQARVVEFRENRFTGHALGYGSHDGEGRGPGAGGNAGGMGWGEGRAVSGAGSHQQGQHGQGQHGHGQHSHNRLLTAIGDCQAMLALGMGPRLEQDLMSAGIEVYFTRDKDIERVTQMLAEGTFASHPDGSACKDHHHH